MDIDRTEHLLERLALLLRGELREVAAQHGLPLAQLDVLRYLGACNRFSDTLSGIVEYLGVTKGTLSQTTQALERKGLLVRFTDPADGRIQHARLTEAGARIVEKSRGTPIQARLRREAVLEPALEALLLEALQARGGRAFGLCAACRHHQQRDGARRCGLLNVELSEDDAGRICREYAEA